MAHYRKKNFKSEQTTYRSKAEMYKKSKWEKFKENLSHKWINFKRFFQKIMVKVDEKGSQKLTIMLVPHSGKKIFNLQISNYIMSFVSGTIVVVLAISIFSMAKGAQTAAENNYLSSETETQQYMIEEFERSIADLNERFTYFKSDVSTILSEDEDTDYFDVEEIPIDQSLTNENVPDEVVELERLGMELDIIKENLWRITTFIDDKETLLEEIPSIYPLASRARISSPYGPRVDPIYRTTTDFHSGIDLATIPGTPVFAAADGEIDTATYSSGYGNMVKIEHKYGFYTRYAHLQSFAPGIAAGEQVKQGQVIGYLGSTGRSTGYHLHYEVLIGTSTVNPQPFISMLP